MKTSHMDSAAFTSLLHWQSSVDRWAELASLLPVLILLEFILSTDNAIALAAIAKRQVDPLQERRALDIGIVTSLLLRIALILAAQWILKFQALQLVAGLYLLFLATDHWLSPGLDESGKIQHSNKSSSRVRSFPVTVLIIAATDLAFSIDSIAAAVAVSDQLILVITGACIGVFALRFTAALFIRWLDKYPRLESSGYIAVGFVGLKLIIQLLVYPFALPEWLVPALIIPLFVWGFSVRRKLASEKS